MSIVGKSRRQLLCDMLDRRPRRLEELSARRYLSAVSHERTASVSGIGVSLTLEVGATHSGEGLVRWRKNVCLVTEPGVHFGDSVDDVGSYLDSTTYRGVSTSSTDKMRTLLTTVADKSYPLAVDVRVCRPLRRVDNFALEVLQAR